MIKPKYWFHQDFRILEGFNTLSSNLMFYFTIEIEANLMCARDIRKHWEIFQELKIWFEVCQTNVSSVEFDVKVEKMNEVATRGEEWRGVKNPLSLPEYEWRQELKTPERSKIRTISHSTSSEVESPDFSTVWRCGPESYRN